jgi:hypothetical protein
MYFDIQIWKFFHNIIHITCQMVCVLPRVWARPENWSQSSGMGASEAVGGLWTLFTPRPDDAFLPPACVSGGDRRYLGCPSLVSMGLRWKHPEWAGRHAITLVAWNGESKESVSGVASPYNETLWNPTPLCWRDYPMGSWEVGSSHDDTSDSLHAESIVKQ